MVDDVVGIFVLYRIVDYIVEVLAMMGEAVVDYTKLQRVTLLQYTPTPVGKQGTRINTIDRALQASPVKKKGHRIG